MYKRSTVQEEFPALSFKMASASTLSGLYIADDYDLVCSGENLRDCFNQFKVGAQHTARNVLRGFLSLHEAKEVFGPSFVASEAKIAVGPLFLAMGDLNVVEHAQYAHLSA